MNSPPKPVEWIASSLDDSPKQDIELIEARLKRAKEHYEQYYKQRLEENKNE